MKELVFNIHIDWNYWDLKHLTYFFLLYIIFDEV
jgi:hypothetical protein